MYISVKRVRDAMSDLHPAETSGRDEAVEFLDAAIKNLESAQNKMDTIMVCGREPVDVLLGCMMAIDALLGRGEDNG